jgi:hypothetical protein
MLGGALLTEKVSGWSETRSKDPAGKKLRVAGLKKGAENPHPFPFFAFRSAERSVSYVNIKNIPPLNIGV